MITESEQIAIAAEGDDPNHQDSDTRQVVTFQIGEEDYSFDIVDVREIIRPVKLTRIPLSPAHVKGVANLRGDILPILDLRDNFGVAAKENSDKSRILVIDRNQTLTGLCVDAVHQVTTINASDIESQKGSSGKIQDKYLSHISKLDDGRRIVIGLDPEKICEIQIDQSQFDRAHSQETNGSDSVAKAVESTFISVVFNSDGIEYGLRIESVQEIIRCSRPRRLPDAPPYLTGILSLRGSILPVLDFRRLMGRQTVESQHLEELAISQNLSNSWIQKTEVAIKTASFGSTLLQAGRKVLDSAAALRSSNNELNKSYDALRLNLQSGFLRLSEYLSQGSSYSVSDLKTLKSQILDSYASCEKRIQEGAKDDQKIVVTHMGGVQVGLLVDFVREVGVFPNSCIDSAPSLSRKGNIQLEGVMKLDGGKRMILALEPSHLLSEGDQERLFTSLRKESHKPEKESPMSIQESVSVEEIQLVCFRIGEDEYGAPIEHIREIDRVSKITAIPEAPRYVDGITNLRGEVLTVIGLRKRFSLPEREIDDKARIIVIDVDGNKTGLRVDSVSHVIRIPRDIVTGPPKEASDAPINNFITGIAKADEGKRIIILVDLQKLLSQTEAPVPRN